MGQMSPIYFDEKYLCVLCALCELCGWVRSLSLRQIAANNNRRRSAIMEISAAEILLIRPPPPGRERAQASPRAQAALRKRGATVEPVHLGTAG